jgi:IS5 family transposase
MDLSRESAPDATTLLHFRRLLEEHGLPRRVFAAINAHPAAQGLLLKEGSIMDATCGSVFHEEQGQATRS